MKKIYALRNILLIFLLGWNWACQNKTPISDQQLTAKWADMALFITKNTPSNSPTFASRGFGYIGLTMYESVVNSDSSYLSLNNQLDGLNELPKPLKSKKYHWQIVLNAAQASIIKNIYTQTSDANKLKIDSLEKELLAYYSKNIQDEESIQSSINFGKNIANTIFEWSKTDGGHRGYLRNFDKKMTYPNKLGSWKPPLYGQSFSHFPLQPHWGENRTFLSKNHTLIAPEFIPFDSIPGTPYYKQFLAVYEQGKKLTQAQKEAAIWWGDDPDETVTPPGHSYYLATLTLKQTKPNLMKCAETYAKVALSVADAFTNCWKWKYQFFTERPNTFIPKYIDQRWESFWPDPPFPAFPSGHAIQAGAASTVLISLFGDKMNITDDTHQGRNRDEVRNVDFKVRHFTSFSQIAEEVAMSRFYGGIHTPQDNEAGLKKGKEIAENILGLQWKK